MADPVDFPLHRTSILSVFRANGSWSKTSAESIVKQPLLSFNVSVYCPGHKLKIESLLAPVSQENVYGDIPPEGVDITFPLQSLKHNTSVIEKV